jgi:hemerythrin-like domain-containing protein
MDDADTRTARRRALLLFGGAAAAGTIAACGGAQSARGGGEAHGGDEGISATEDLMREHGVLRRIFLAYDEAARRLRATEALDPTALHRAARLVRTFAEDYHERGEERWVFPVLQRAAATAHLVEVLAAQHQRGRVITDEILRLTASGAAPDGAGATRLAALCESFTRMYRPHAAREDTVVFPALRASLGRHEFHELGERMEEAEHATVGEGGFERAVAEVAEIERALGIADLARFTAAEA